MTADFLDTMQGDSGTTSKDQKKKKKKPVSYEFYT